jgi:hypothetical protein
MKVRRNTEPAKKNRMCKQRKKYSQENIKYKDSKKHKMELA